jgi:hypothetical protein
MKYDILGSRGRSASMCRDLPQHRALKELLKTSSLSSIACIKTLTVRHFVVLTQSIVRSIQRTQSTPTLGAGR